jgi:integrase
MKQHGTTRQNSESGKAVAKQAKLLTASSGVSELEASVKVADPTPETGKASSRFTPAYWLDRIYRPAYTREGRRVEVLEFYARIQHGGRREAVPLHTNTREEAARKAARLYKAVNLRGWHAALKEFRPDANAAPKTNLTIGEYLQTVRPVIDVRERSFGCYSYALRKIASEAVGGNGASKKRFDPVHCPWRKEADRIFLAKLTTEQVEVWKRQFVAKAGTDERARQRTKRSANSFLRNAKALFGRRVLKSLAKKGVTLPSPLPFDGLEMEDKTGSTQYVSTINAAKLLQAARAKLRAKDRDAYAVVLLALGAGLRRGEIDALQWQQVDFDKSEIRVMNSADFTAKTDESEGRVYVDSDLLAELKPLRAGASSLFVVETRTPMRTHTSAQFYRCDETFDRVTKWLRANGVLANKPLHLLRKEFGSIINEQADIHTASRQLRHSNLSTTANYYADHRRRSVVAVGAMLNANKEPAKKAKKG